MTTPYHPPRLRRRRLPERLVWLAIRTVRRANRTVVRRLSPRSVTIRGGGRRQPSPVRLSIVDDPDGSLRMVGIHGQLDRTSIDGVVDLLAGLDDRPGLHLDLAGATIRGATTLRGLEAMIDELERRGVQMRVVGVDPGHPALVPPGRS